VFLERLFSGTYTMLGYNAFMIATGVGDDGDRLRFDNQKSLSGFWASLSIITNELRSNMWESQFINLNVTDIQLNNHGDIYFDLSYRCPRNFVPIDITARNYIEIDGTQLDRNRVIERLETLRKAQEQFAIDLFMNILESGMRTALTIAIPPMGAFYTAMDLVSNTPNSISGYRQLTNNQAIKDGIMVGNFSLQTFNRLLSLNGITGELAEAQRETFIAWFGSGVTTDFTLPGLGSLRGGEEDLERVSTVLEGLYNPNTIRQVWSWEESGLVGLGILDQNQVNVVLASPEFDGFGEGAQNDIKTLLEGGFTIIDDSGFDSERFLRAISRIDRILDVDIQRDWNDRIGGIRNEQK